MFNEGPNSPLYRAFLYQLLHRGNPGDLRFYAERCRGARRVLELGCGAGRVLGVLAALDLEVVGLDIDPEMLALARQRAHAATLVEGDMRCFSFDGQFDRIFLPFNSLFTLTTDDDMRACLHRIREQLGETGELCFDAYVMDPDSWPGEGHQSKFSPLIQIWDGERQLRVYERLQRNELSQSFDASYRFEWLDGCLEDNIRHHFLWPEQVEPLLKSCGLKVTSFAGDFEGGPFDDDCTQMVVRAGLA